jgi:hypothetical protein
MAETKGNAQQGIFDPSPFTSALSILSTERPNNAVNAVRPNLGESRWPEIGVAMTFQKISLRFCDHIMMSDCADITLRSRTKRISSGKSQR